MTPVLGCAATLPERRAATPIAPPRAEEDRRHLAQLIAGALTGSLHLGDRVLQPDPRLPEDRLQDLVLGREIVVEEPVRDPRFLGDVTHAAGMEALAREDTDGRVQDQATFVFRSD